MNPFGSLRKGLNEFFLLLTCFDLDDVVVRFGYGKFEHICGLNVRRLLKHCHQLGDVKELCKACLCSVSATIGCKLYCRYRLAKGRCPSIKIEKSAQLKLIVLKVFLHRVKLYHRIGDRRTRCKHTTLSSCQFVKITTLHIEVGGFLCFGL